MPYGTVNADVIQTSTTGGVLGAGNASIMKNRIINGAMVIDQRNAGASSAFGTTGAYTTVDRYQTYNNTSGTATNQQVVDAPAGFYNSLKVTITASATPASGELFQIQQVIEGYNIADLAFGTANAKTITLSFWVKSSLTGQFGGAVQDGSAGYGYPFSYTISVANTWEQKSVTITGATSGTWGVTNSAGLRLYLDLGCGSTYLGTAGSWSANGYRGATGDTKLVSTNGATWNITGVQLEVGSSATGYEYRQYTTELQLCQRYCFLLTSVGGSGSYIRWATGENSGTTANNTPIMFPTTMRTSASLTTTGTASNYALSSNGSGISATAISTQSNACTNQTHAISVSVASGLVSGGCSTLVSNNNNTAYLLFTAEL
jgi:hypothetical protein